MPFTPGYGINKTDTKTTSGFTPGYGIDQTKKKDVGVFVPGKKDYASSHNLKTSEGLYNVAARNGLQDKADSIIAKNTGENNQIFSGGLITDFFDGLNALDYGVVGVLKGKTFEQGVKNRESFANKDSVGANGVAGVVVGTLLDIAVDPLTYLAPWTILKKIPGTVKVVNASKNAIFGTMKLRAIEDGTGRIIQELDGGTAIGKMAADKFAYMFGKDPVYKEIIQRSERNLGKSATYTKKLTDEMLALPEDKFNKLIQMGADFRPERADLASLSKVLSPEELAGAKRASDFIDGLGQDMVDLGLLDKATYLENKGRYLKAIPEKYSQTATDTIGGFFKKKITGVKGRKDLTEEVAAQQNYIKNPAYIFAKTAMDMVKDIENAKLFNNINSSFGTDVIQKGFTQMPQTAKFITNAGKQAELLGGVKKINTDLKPLLSGLKSTFKADKNVLGDIGKLETKLSGLGKLQGEELYKFFNEPVSITKTTTTARKLGTIPEKLQPIANVVKKYENFQDLYKSADGIQLEKLFENGDLQRNGFSSMEKFFETVKSPFKASETKGTTKLVKDTPKFNAATKARSVESDLLTGRGVGGKTPIVRGANAPAKTNIFGEVPTIKVAIKELDLLKNKFSQYNKGFKAGVSATSKEISNAQEDLVKIITKNFPKEERGAFLNKVRLAINPAKLSEATDFLRNKFDDMLTKKEATSTTKQITKLVQLQKEIEKIMQKSSTLKEIDKTSINDSFRYLEKSINDLRFAKEDLLGTLSDVKLANLAGKYVPDSIHKDLTEMLRKPTEFEQLLRNATSEYKFFKVVLNPASNIRNIISNKLLNNFDEAGMPLYRLDKEYQGLRSFLTKDKWYKEVEDMGGAVDTFTSQEIGNILDTTKLGKLGSGYGKFKESVGGIYQGEEMMAKMSMYIFQRTTKKLSPEEAWTIAERATFNYAQVTPFVRNLRSNLFGFPFITFTVKSTPVIAKTVMTHPTKISNIGKIKNSIEKLGNIKQTEEERASEPSWVKNGFYMKLPFKDDQGRSAYFDLTYILPFGDLATLGDENNLSIFSKSPALGIIRDLGRNEDFYGAKLWKESDSSAQKSADIMRYLTKAILPPPIADQIPGGYSKQTGKRVDPLGRIGSSLEASPENQRRSLQQEMARMAGMKVQPLSANVQESMNEWNKKKDLEALLTENQVGATRDSFYIPKNK